MRGINVTNAGIDLTDRNIPFKPNYTVVVMNPTAGALTLQSGPNGSDWNALQVVPAGSVAEVMLNDDFVRVSTAATLILLGN